MYTSSSYKLQLKVVQGRNPSRRGTVERDSHIAMYQGGALLKDDPCPTP